MWTAALFRRFGFFHLDADLRSGKAKQEKQKAASKRRSPKRCGARVVGV